MPAPVLVRHGGQCLIRGELCALRLICDGLLFWPARCGDAAAEVDEFLFGNVDAEGTDCWMAEACRRSAPRALISSVRDRLPTPQPLCDQLGPLPVVAPV